MLITSHSAEPQGWTPFWLSGPRLLLLRLGHRDVPYLKALAKKVGFLVEVQSCPQYSSGMVQLKREDYYLVVESYLYITVNALEVVARKSRFDVCRYIE